MKPSFILAALVATVAAMPAAAQPVAADLLPAYEVATIVASMGMRPVGRPAWLRGRYVVATVDRHGREVNVVLDARDGQVLAVRPLSGDSFGAPPPPRAYGPRPAPYDPMDGAAPAPDAMPGSPPPDGEEFFDHDRQQSALPPPARARTAPRPGSQPQPPAVTGSVPGSPPAERRDTPAADQVTNSPTPMPRPRPALAKANDPSHVAAQPADKPSAAARPDEKKGAGKKSAATQALPPVPTHAPAAGSQAAKPEQSGKPEEKRDVRVIDLSKPKSAPKSEDKPGEAIRF